MLTLFFFDCVAEAADRVDEFFGEAAVDFFAEVSDVHIYDAAFCIGGVRPDAVEDHVAGEDAAGVGHEILEKLEFGLGEVNQIVAAFDLERAWVEFEIPDLQFAISGSGLAEAGFDARNEFVAGKRLGDVVIGT